VRVAGERVGAGCVGCKLAAHEVEHRLAYAGVSLALQQVHHGAVQEMLRMHRVLRAAEDAGDHRRICVFVCCACLCCLCCFAGLCLFVPTRGALPKLL
jgi:hypothetical protein